MLEHFPHHKKADWNLTQELLPALIRLFFMSSYKACSLKQLAKHSCQQINQGEAKDWVFLRNGSPSVALELRDFQQKSCYNILYLYIINGTFEGNMEMFDDRCFKKCY